MIEIVSDTMTMKIVLSRKNFFEIPSNFLEMAFVNLDISF